MTERPDSTLPEVAEASATQARAADPAVSAWVSANAGSGKTRVLTERVARLLLAGFEPARILCLTYTRAAAAEMADRLSRLLGRWALMDNAALAADLGAIAGAADLSTDDLARARRLFAKALETPGGLKIQTIHAFCAAALRRFPLEAGVSPDFTEIDDAARDELAARARERLAEAAEAGTDDSFDAVAAHTADEGLAALCEAVLKARRLFRDPPDAGTICTAFGVRAADLGEDPLAAWWQAFDRARGAQAARALLGGSTNDQRLGKPLTAAIATGRVADLEPTFYTAKGPRILEALPTKPTAAAHTWLKPWLHEVAESYHAARAHAAALAAAGRAIALNRFGAAFLAAYEAEKRARAALDFDDLVERALALIANPETGPWALFKLDGGIDHLLVDEAQDTSPDQWRLVEALTAEFGAGGAGRPDRTLFVVGDEKQSIYSFQGAAPQLFGAMRLRFAERMAAAPLELDLRTSFRSAPVVVRAVDTILAPVPEGLSARGVPPSHVSAWPGRPGRVDLWPVIGRDEAAPEPAWDEPIGAPAPADPRLRLARLLADEIARWIATGEPLPGAGRPVRPGDILVLVRRRDRLAAELVRRLKRLGVAVAGADRIVVAEALAVRDLLAAARVALNPADDLSLAALLRSPLCGLSEAALFALAHGRDGPLWPRLRDSGRHPEAAAFVARRLDTADFLRPFEFFDTILTREGGRHRLLARLGLDAEEAIDELLAQALAWESKHTPSLGGFLDWLTRADVEIRREQDKGAGAVRVMTVHGAKGLEAPVVILPDTLSTRLGRAPEIVPVDAVGRSIAAWRAPRGAVPPLLAAADERAEALQREESRRLLYVAMTRAERWLVLAGAGKLPKAECWHALAEAGLCAAGAVRLPGPEGLEGPILRLAEGEPGTPDTVGTETAEARALPAWTAVPPPAPPPRALRRTASHLSDPVVTAHGGAGGGDLARRRGIAVHALLEVLPALPAAERPARASRLLARLAPADAAHHAGWIAEALALLAMPDAAPWFGPAALAEVALSVDLPGGRVEGRVDRMLVGPGAVRVLDVKTDAAPPAEAPEPYLRQMAAYAAALGAIYPHRQVEAVLLWTAERRIEVLPPVRLAAALAAITAAEAPVSPA